MQEILLIALVVLLFFGGKKIPELMKGLGKGVKSFKDGMNGLEDGKKEDKKEDKEDDDEKKKGEKYSLLESELNTLKAEYQDLQTKYQELVAFKTEIDNQKKDALISEFYMLADEDKADVIANIDNYSVDDIEAKLSIICVRNKVSFDLENDNKETDPISYNLNDTGSSNDNVPEWIKAIQNHVAENN